MKSRILDLSSLGLGLLTLGVIVGAWFYLTPDIIVKRQFPSPEDVWSVFSSLSFGDLAEHISSTFGRVIGGWALGCFLGNKMGLLMARSKIVRGVITPIVEGLRPIPAVALIPFFIAWFGPGSLGQIILIAMACFMVMTISTIGAIGNLPQRYVRSARLLGASSQRAFRTVIKPAIAPEQVAGLRIAAALAFAIGVAAELMGAQSGLGFLIMVARQSSATDVMLLCIVIITLGSVLLDQVIKAISAYRLRWHESSIDSIYYALGRFLWRYIYDQSKKN